MFRKLIWFLPLHLRTEADPFSEMLCYLVILDFRMMDKVQKPISSKEMTSMDSGDDGT
jgi:hypothetical protein